MSQEVLKDLIDSEHQFTMGKPSKYPPTSSSCENYIKVVSVCMDLDRHDRLFKCMNLEFFTCLEPHE